MTRSLLLFLVFLATAAVGVGTFLVPRGAAPVALAGTPLRPIVAPPFRLRDQWGRTITPRTFRGHPFVVTFTDATCTTLCPIEAEKIAEALRLLGGAANRVGVVAISTAPEVDTPAAVRRFSTVHGLLHRWHFLVGPRVDMIPVWSHYWVYVAPPGAPASERDSHTTATFVIDGAGKERALFTSELTAAGLARDLRMLLGLAPGSGAQAVPAPLDGHPAPAFALTDLTGSRVSLGGMRGGPALLNFWATYCVPCRSEMPALQQWARTHPGVRVLGIDQEESARDVATFLRRFHVTYRVALDTNGTVSGRYDLIGLPTTVLIDGKGIVRARRTGTVTMRWLDRQATSLH